MNVGDKCGDPIVETRLRMMENNFGSFPGFDVNL